MAPIWIEARFVSMLELLKQRFSRHTDFFLGWLLFVTFRLGTVWFFRPGGYIRDYSDLIFYQTRASWQDFGLLPYRDYWSEYPPLFAWLTLWIDTLSRRIPLWEDERLWYVVLFGLLMVAAEGVTLLSLYWLARRLYGASAFRVVWLYAGFFLPVYLLSGWFDALPVATVMVGLVIAVNQPQWGGALLFGLITGIGGLLKLVPLALTALLPLATKRISRWFVGIGTALLVMLLGYGIAYQQGPVMTMASLRSLRERSGWSTLYAWSNGYTRLGKVLGDVFDPMADVSLYASWYPERLIWLFWLAVGALLFALAYRQAPTPQSPRRLVLFAALTYAILLVAYPAWNPQYLLYLLPFLVLVWPNVRGVLYALLLSAVVLLEHPIYHNLLGPGYAPAYANLVEADYKELLLLLIIGRTFLLLVVALNLALELLRPQTRVRWLPVLATVCTFGLLVSATPQFVQAYQAGRLATSPLRSLVRLLNTTDQDWPVVSQQLALGRELRPLLTAPERLILMGGRPGRLEPLPSVAQQGAFLYLQAENDDLSLAPMTNAAYRCEMALTIRQWQLWYCNGAPITPVARFAAGVELLGASQPVLVQDRLHLTLLWRTQAPIAADYTVFVHLVDHNGTMIGQWDQMPGANTNPTTTWLPNTVVVDDYQIPLQRTGAPPYQVLVGLYAPTTGARLAIEQSTRPLLSDDRLQLYEVTLP
ncbi:MAG: hypothetical protein KF832_03790 [Caldilineaceae bacterium]|nr:hypothetical protein [Caldilineaceae bacterium]